MFRFSADAVVTLGFHYGPIRAAVRHPTEVEEEEITAGPRHPSLSSPELCHVQALMDGTTARRERVIE